MIDMNLHSTLYPLGKEEQAGVPSLEFAEFAEEQCYSQTATSEEVPGWAAVEIGGLGYFAVCHENML